MIDILYIAGAGRSGSTLLERLLGQFPECVAVGETRHLWRQDPAVVRCGCGRLLAECDFWRQAVERAAVPMDADGFRQVLAVQERVDRIRYVPRLLAAPLAGAEFAQRRDAYSETLRCLYSAFHDIGGGRVIVDSSKDISTLYLLSRMEGVRLRLLHLVRDSRAVAYSWTKQMVRPHVTDHVAYMHTYSPAWSSADWTYRNVLTEAARPYAGGYLRLRYVDLVAKPHETLRRVAEFMDMPDVDLSFVGPDEVQLSRTLHTVGGNPMKFKPGNLRLRLDDAWRESFAPGNRALVTALTWPLLWRYGYRRAEPAAVAVAF